VAFPGYSRRPVSFGTQCLVGLTLILGYGGIILQRQTLSYFAPAVRAELHLSSAEFAQLFTALSIGLIAGYAVMTAVVAVAGARWALLAGFAGVSVAAILSGLAPGYGVLVVTRFLLGFFAGALLPAGVQSARDCFPSHMRPMLIGFLFASGAAASFLSPLLLPLALRFAGWRPLSSLTALPTLLAAVLCLTVWPAPVPVPGISRGVSTSAIASAGMAAIGLLFAAPALATLATYLPVHQSRNFGLSSVRTTTSVAQLFNLWGAVLTGAIAWVMMEVGGRAGRVRAVLLTVYGCILPLVALAAIPNRAATLIASVLPGLAYFGWATLLYWAVADNLPQRGVAIGAGLAALMATVGSLAANAIPQTLGARYGYPALFVLAGVVAAMGAAAVLVLAWFSRDEQPD
jgi:MFS family permease